MSNDGILPQELITDVLSRVPVKSLCRFKSVSHSWKTLISDPHFAKTHLNRTNTQNSKNLARKIILLSRSHNLYSVDFADVIPTATKLDFPTVEQQTDALKVWGSCNGLLLVSGMGNSNFLLNPSTREFKKLQTRPLPHDLVAGFYVFVYVVGHDSRTDDYKVVMFSCSIMSDRATIDVYSLKNDAWRRIEKISLICSCRLAVGFYLMGVSIAFVGGMILLRLLLSISRMSFSRKCRYLLRWILADSVVSMTWPSMGIFSVLLFLGSLVNNLKFGS